MSNERAREELGILLDARPDRVESLLAAVREGRIDGGFSRIWLDDPEPACCVMGHIFEQDRAESPSRIGQVVLGMADFGNMSDIEYLVDNVRPGDVPATSPALALVEGWITSWQAQRSAS